MTVPPSDQFTSAEQEAIKLARSMDERSLSRVMGTAMATWTPTQLRRHGAATFVLARRKDVPESGDAPIPRDPTDDMVERVARRLYHWGHGFDIDADPTARRAMLSLAADLLRAAFDERQHDE